MEYYHSWQCEIATKEMPFSQCTLGIDYLSGCYYNGPVLLGTISGSSIDRIEGTEEYDMMQ